MPSKTMLVIAPHPDDEILGAGGIISRFSKAGGEVYILTIAAHKPPLFSEEIHQKTLSEARKAHNFIGVKRSIFLDKAAVFLNEEKTSDFNSEIQKVINEIKPQIVLIPYFDRHIDHRVIFDAAMVTTRPVGIGREIQILAAYETLSETHWNAPHIEPNFTPNWVVDITANIDHKLKAFSYYESQVHKFPSPRSIEALKALSLFRGSQAGFAFGEGFHIIRMVCPPECLL